MVRGAARRSQWSDHCSFEFPPSFACGDQAFLRTAAATVRLSASEELSENVMWVEGATFVMCRPPSPSFSSHPPTRLATNTTHHRTPNTEHTQTHSPYTFLLPTNSPDHATAPTPVSHAAIMVRTAPRTRQRGREEWKQSNAR